MTHDRKTRRGVLPSWTNEEDVNDTAAARRTAACSVVALSVNVVPLCSEQLICLVRE